MDVDSAILYNVKMEFRGYIMTYGALHYAKIFMICGLKWK